MAVTTPLRVTLPTFSDSTRTWSPTSTIVASFGRDELRPSQVFPGDRRAHASGAVVTVVLAIRSSLEAASDTAAYGASMMRRDLLAMRWLPGDTRQLLVATG
jgi:hypothetical protein